MTDTFIWIYPFILNGLFFVLLSLFCLRFLSIYFPISFSSERSALVHEPVIRGVGIVFPIILLISSILFFQSIKFDVIFIFFFTLIGFYDDLKNISYKKKIYLIISVFLLFFIFETNIILFDNLNLFFSVFISVIVLTFYILFFNQIDGINGLSSGIFCGVLLGLIFLYPEQFINNKLFFSILGMVIFYFAMNLMKIKFFQGDAGAFFLGASTYLFIHDNNELILIFFILIFPIIGDIVWTTLMRIYFKFNIFKAHKNNFYQKTAAKIKSHFFTTIPHLIFQGILILIIYSINLQNKSILTHFIVLIFLSVLFSIFYIYTSYQCNKPTTKLRPK